MSNPIQSNCFFIVAVFVAGIACGAVMIGLTQNSVEAASVAPTEHKGLTVQTLGAIDAQSMKATLGLEGHKLQLRAITIEPGGHIAEHSHETRPGLVRVISGEWIEGRAAGESAFSAVGSEAILEDEKTTHWFFNRGDKSATAIVCDIVPDE